MKTSEKIAREEKLNQAPGLVQPRVVLQPLEGRNPLYVLQSGDGTTILTIWPDGRAELGPAVATLDEASQLLWAFHLAQNPLRGIIADARRQCPVCNPDL